MQNACIRFFSKTIVDCLPDSVVRFILPPRVQYTLPYLQTNYIRPGFLAHPRLMHHGMKQPLLLCTHVALYCELLAIKGSNSA